MRLSTEKAIEFVENLEKYHPIQKYWDESNERHRQEKNTENYPYSYFRGVLIRKITEIIEALQQENEQLKADCDRMLGEVQELTMESNHFKERLQISPYGDDKIDELDEALENCKFQYEQLKQENEQLQAQVAR